MLYYGPKAAALTRRTKDMTSVAKNTQRLRGAIAIFLSIERAGCQGRYGVRLEDQWAFDFISMLAQESSPIDHAATKQGPFSIRTACGTVGSEQAGPRVAAIVSIVETCRRLNVAVRNYLRSVFPGLANFPINRIAELTPVAWMTR
jgi:hypothetical protein